MFQTVQSDLIHGMEPHPQFSFREALAVHPDEIMVGNIADQSSFVLPKRHSFRHQVSKDFLLHPAKLREQPGYFDIFSLFLHVGLFLFLQVEDLPNLIQVF